MRAFFICKKDTTDMLKPAQPRPLRGLPASVRDSSVGADLCVCPLPRPAADSPTARPFWRADTPQKSEK